MELGTVFASIMRTATARPIDMVNPIPGSSRSWRRFGVLFGLALLSTISASCAPSATASQSPAPTAIDIHNPTVTTVPNADPDPLQQELLADGALSHAEMERALLAVVSCVREGGFTADLVEFVHGEGWSLDISGGPTGGQTDKAEARFNDCSARLLSDVEVAYLMQHRPTKREIEAANAEMLDCFKAEGFVVQDRGTIGEFLASLPAEDALELFETCEERINNPSR